ncbi:MAG: chromosomal replication initiator protein DnaA [Oscillospiraceae bacterium]|nr:chromosomal replication initiator protein DnaA [Oscillospiraceae bacterium]MCI8877497.1 chromosomal replication initiator protein DnaA [Oscillospiraceae bacterium]
MQSVADIWTMILTRLREDLSETTIKTWFDETSVVSLEGNTLVLHCPNEFKRSNIQDRFLPSIEASLKDIFSSDMTVRLLDDEGLRLYRHPEEKRPASFMESGEFTFETFVVGPSNTLAHAAAQAVADAPGQHYNPLLIYGDSGLGKTHLLYAIAHVIRSREANARLVYIKGDDFINEFIELIRAGRGSEFRTKYREADLLLVDDVQFLAGKEQVQNEFFHTFNTLYESKKQIVLTSDRPPHEMTLLDDRLRTRFEWGLLTDVTPPDLETRIAILKNKAVQLGFLLDDETASYIAAKITANVRQLEGTVKKIKAFKELHGMPVNKDTADRAIRDMSQSNEFIITPEHIIKEVCRYYHLEEDQIRGPSRSRDCLNARQVAMYLIRRMTSLSQDDVGQHFGGRDHATVINSIKKVEKQMTANPAFAETVKAITTNINSAR